LLISKEVEVKLHSTNIRYYEEKGYPIPRKKDKHGRFLVPRGSTIIVKIKDLQLSNIFDVTVSPEALTLYVNYLRNALRSPIANTKDRGDVSGGGKKPYKQKGTGRARAGSSRSPLWVGGGVTFGPTSDRNFLGVLGEAFKENKSVVFENLALKDPKTNAAVGILDAVKATGKISVILDTTDTNAQMSFRNLAGIKLMSPNRLNVIDLMSSSKVITSMDALNKIEELFSDKK